MVIEQSGAASAYDIYSRLLKERRIPDRPVDDATANLVVAQMCSWSPRIRQRHQFLHHLPGGSISAGWRSTTRCSSSARRIDLCVGMAALGAFLLAAGLAAKGGAPN
jgi:ATP-dependent protease ClpP protease subunit